MVLQTSSKEVGNDPAQMSSPPHPPLLHQGGAAPLRPLRVAQAPTHLIPLNSRIQEKIRKTLSDSTIQTTKITFSMSTLMAKNKLT